MNNIAHYWANDFNTKLGYLHYFMAYYMKYSRFSFIEASRFVLKQSENAKSGKTSPEYLSDCGYYCHEKNWHYVESDFQALDCQLLASLIFSSDI